jgi:hypothetical protein
LDASRKLIGIAFVVMIVLAFVGVLAFNYFAVEQPLHRVLTTDTRNQVVTASAHFEGWIGWNTLVFDITDVSGSAREIDVFRTFLQYAQAMKGRRFDKVILACRGTKKFTLDGDYFQQLGQEYENQNPMYTIRTFPTHLAAMDGSKPFPDYVGGMLGVLEKEMEQFTEFNAQWYMRDLAARIAEKSKPEPPPSSPTVSSTPVASPSSAATTDNWHLHESQNEMDKTPEVTLHTSGSDGATLFIRCAEHKTEAFVNTETILDNEGVRVRFDDSSPVRQAWSKSTDHKALFAPDAITFARDLTKAQKFFFEFTPFEERERTISFEVSGLDGKLQKVSDTCNWDAIDKSRARSKAAESALRAKIDPYVHPCKVSATKGWCWSDPNDTMNSVIPNYETYGGETREQAIQEAMRSARWGIAFKGVIKESSTQ